MEFNCIDPEFPDNEWDEELKKELDKYLRYEKVGYETKKDMMENPRYNEIFEDMPSELSKKLTIDTYSREKSMYAMHGDIMLNNLSRENYRWEYYSEEALCEIQQKKLFDMQCQWRSGELKIKGVKTTHDFKTYEVNIRNCPFISPVNEKELKHYINFLKSEQYRPTEKVYEWQDYDSIKNEKMNEVEVSKISLWYQYHDYVTKNKGWHLLPDIKGDKEKYYLEIYDDYRKKTLAENPYTDIPDNRPRLLCDDETVNNFLRRFNEKGMLYYNELFEDRTPYPEGGLYFGFASMFMKKEKKTIPIEENEDWQIAFLELVFKYKRKKIAKMLPDLFADYLKGDLEKMLPYILKDDIVKEQKMRKDLAAKYQRMILIARKELGEDGNFRY